MALMVDLHKEKMEFMKKWAPLEPYGPSFRKNFSLALDNLIEAAVDQATELAVEAERLRIMRELKRLFTIDIDKVIKGEEASGSSWPTRRPSGFVCSLEDRPFLDPYDSIQIDSQSNPSPPR